MDKLDWRQGFDTEPIFNSSLGWDDDLSPIVISKKNYKQYTAIVSSRIDRSILLIMNNINDLSSLKALINLYRCVEYTDVYSRDKKTQRSKKLKDKYKTFVTIEDKYNFYYNTREKYSDDKIQAKNVTYTDGTYTISSLSLSYFEINPLSLKCIKSINMLKFYLTVCSSLTNQSVRLSTDKVLQYTDKSHLTRFLQTFSKKTGLFVEKYCTTIIIRREKKVT